MSFFEQASLQYNTVFNDRISQRFNKHASTYDVASPLQQQSAQHLLSMLNIIPEQIVLDAGCGTGVLARALATRGTKVWAIDLATHMLDTLNELENIQTICADMRDLPMPDDMLDVVVSNFSAHWAGTTILPELYRVVRPQGALFLAIPIQPSLAEIAQQYEGFPIYDFQSEQDWLQAAQALTTLVDSPIQSSQVMRFSQTYANLHALMRDLKHMGGNQLAAHQTAATVAQLKQWFLQDKNDGLPITLTYHVLYLHLIKPIDPNAFVFPRAT